ncbi:MAG: hypothetical protein R2827_09285 [Bdellovibrionales bacterium]
MSLFNLTFWLKVLPIDKIVGHEVVLKNGGEVKSLQFVEGKSTTNIIGRILSESKG